MTFFGTAQPWFQPIPEDKRILTGPFLDAARNIIPFFDRLGTGFKFVKNDISGNIDKMNKKYQEDPEKYVTVNDIIEATGGKGDKVLKDAHIGVIWLTRGLEFIQQLLVEVVEDYEGECDLSEGSSELIKQAYQKTLEKHHGLVMRNIFKPFTKMAPYKCDLLNKLKSSDDVSNDRVIAEMKDYQRTMSENAATVQAAVTAHGLKD